MSLSQYFIRCVRLACQPTSQQYCSLILNQHWPPAISQSAVLFSRNKLAPAISRSQTNTTIVFVSKPAVNLQPASTLSPLLSSLPQHLIGLWHVIILALISSIFFWNLEF